MIDVKAIESRLRDIFEENFEFIKAEGGHSITDFIKEEAFLQVLFYLRKNYELILKISEAEVKLTLPEQLTPNTGQKYTIEGVIDILEEGQEAWMYDLKTHERSAVEGNRDLYRQQLNVYAYIWKNLRGNRLDNTAIISTSLPSQLKNAIRSRNPQFIEHEMKRWDPVIPMGYSEDEVETMIQAFGETVEAIEASRFAPPPLERLTSQEAGERNIFAVRVCRNCDARFSCGSFREYVRQSDRGNQGMKKYFDDYGTEFSTEEYIEGNLADLQ